MEAEAPRPWIPTRNDRQGCMRRSTGKLAISRLQIPQATHDGRVDVVGVTLALEEWRGGRAEVLADAEGVHMRLAIDRNPFQPVGVDGFCGTERVVD